MADILDPDGSIFAARLYRWDLSHVSTLDTYAIAYAMQDMVLVRPYRYRLICLTLTKLSGMKWRASDSSFRQHLVLAFASASVTWRGAV